MLDRARRWLFPSACVACDAPGPGLCASCAPSPREAIAFAIDSVPGFALGAYDGPLRDAIVAMKHGLRDPLDAFVALLDRAQLDAPLVPLPTTRRRAAERGFDQSVTIARRVAARRGIGVQELLVKRGAPQAGRDRRERRAATGRFAVRDDAPRPRAVTLFDDVCTTGATARDAIEALRRAGVGVRRLVVLARAGGTSAAARGSIPTQ
ncbi:hypothetical protein WPS_12170 [Vulcanimicrobium alpinum]|uniref:ComF family protein n=1 Tax=Vulcanimicrobium alpinum TaxID=3016050 RepID=A0AAN1XV10_UNVUL|nr:hypothetical protein [Vulcanimicrobium alpinum]BDE05941.1 hypothetical protein WPS_12170 [Vulcanimicrobium alpinum]